MSPKRKSGKTPVRSSRGNVIPLLNQLNNDEISEQGNSGFPVHFENTTGIIIDGSSEVMASEGLPGIPSVENFSGATASGGIPSILSVENSSNAVVLEGESSAPSAENINDAQSSGGNISSGSPQENTSAHNHYIAYYPPAAYVDPNVYIYNQLSSINNFLKYLSSRISTLENGNLNIQGNAIPQQVTTSVLNQVDHPTLPTDVQISIGQSREGSHSEQNLDDNLPKAPDDLVSREESCGSSPPEIIDHSQKVDLSDMLLSPKSDDNDDASSYNSNFSDDMDNNAINFGIHPDSFHDENNFVKVTAADHSHPDITNFCEHKINTLKETLNKTISNFDKKSIEYKKSHRSFKDQLKTLSDNHEKAMTSLRITFDENLHKEVQSLKNDRKKEFDTLHIQAKQSISRIESVEFAVLTNTSKIHDLELKDTTLTSDVINLNNVVNNMQNDILTIDHEMVIITKHSTETSEKVQELFETISEARDDISELKTCQSILENQINIEKNTKEDMIVRINALTTREESNANITQLIQQLPNMVASAVQSISPPRSALGPENPFSSKLLRSYFYPPLVSKLVITGQGGIGPQALESVREFVSRIIKIYGTVYVLPDNVENFNSLRRLFESCMEGDALIWSRSQTVALDNCRDLPFCGPFDSPTKVVLVNVPSLDSDSENAKKYSYLELFLMRFVPFVGPGVFDSHILTEITKEIKRSEGDYLSAKKASDLIQRYLTFISLSIPLQFKIFSNAIDPSLLQKVTAYPEYTKRARLQKQADFDWIVNNVIERESIEADPVKKLNAVLGINNSITNTPPSIDNLPKVTVAPITTNATTNAGTTDNNVAVTHNQHIPLQNITTDLMTRVGRHDARLDRHDIKFENLEWNQYRNQQQQSHNARGTGNIPNNRPFENRSNRDQAQPFNTKTRMLTDPPQNQVTRDPPLGSNGFVLPSSNTNTIHGNESTNQTSDNGTQPIDQRNYPSSNSRLKGYNTRGRNALISALTSDELIRVNNEGKDRYEILVESGTNPDVANILAHEHADNYAIEQFLKTSEWRDSGELADAEGGAASSSA